MHSGSTKSTTRCYKNSRKTVWWTLSVLLPEIKSGTRRPIPISQSIMLQLEIQRPHHLMPATLCHRTNPSQENVYCNINTERKDLNDFSSSPMKGNSITCLCISFVYCEDESQSNSYVSYWIRCKPLLIIKVSFIFPFRTLHVCIIEETWTVWERILTRVFRNTQFYSFDVSSHFWTLYG